MRPLFLVLLALLPLAAGAQQLTATLPPTTYHVGPDKAPLFRRDTLGRAALFAPAYAAVAVVGRFGPRWVEVQYNGFLYLTPVRNLADYEDDDAAPIPIDPQSHLIMFEGVVAAPGASQADLYARARAWIAKEYPGSTAAVQPTNPANDQLLVKGQRPAAVHLPVNGVYRLTTAGVVRHTLAIYLKDGRYRYVLTDLTHDASGLHSIKSGGALEQEHASLYGYGGLGSGEAWADLRVQAIREVRRLLDDLQVAMTLQPVNKKKDPRDF